MAGLGGQIAEHGLRVLVAAFNRRAGEADERRLGQWYYKNAALNGATNNLLDLGPMQTNQAGGYQLTITNLYGTRSSRTAMLTVLVQPNIYGISNSFGGTRTILVADFPGSTNRLWSTTNLTSPMAQWHAIATNIMDANGFSRVTDSNTFGISPKFYRLSSP